MVVFKESREDDHAEGREMVEIKVQGGAERSKHNIINHFINDSSIMEGKGENGTESIALRGLSVTFKTLHILLLHLSAVTPSLISVPDITGKKHILDTTALLLSFFLCQR